MKNRRFDMSMYVAEGRDGGFLRHRRGEADQNARGDARTAEAVTGGSF